MTNSLHATLKAGIAAVAVAALVFSATPAIATQVADQPPILRPGGDVAELQQTSELDGTVTISGRLLAETPSGTKIPVAGENGYVWFFVYNDGLDESFSYYASTDANGNFSLVGVRDGFLTWELNSNQPGARPNFAFSDEGRTIAANETVDLGDLVVPNKTVDTERVGGVNRYDTAAKISERSRTQFSKDGDAPWNVVIVNGLGFADALSAGPLVSALGLTGGSSLLMVESNSIPAETAAELRAANVDSITIVGGTGVVSTAVQTQLASYVDSGKPVTRLAGADRYSTSQTVVSRIDVLVGAWYESFEWEYAGLGLVMMATGNDFPDALAAVPVASGFAAVLLVDGAASNLSSSTLSFLENTVAQGGSVDVIGGVGAVSSSIEAQVRTRGLEGERIAGANRLETSLKIAEEYFGQQAYQATVAAGGNFPDALAAGPATYGPLLLAESNCVPAKTVQYIYDGTYITFVTVAGGTGVLGQGVMDLRSC